MSYWDDDSDDISDEELENMSEVTNNMTDQDGVTVTVNARALDTILEAAAHRIAMTMEKKVTKMVEQRLDALMSESWKEVVGKMAQVAIETYLTKPRVKTNSYGEPIEGTQTTISELIPKTVERWMSAKVDHEGRESEYGKSTRVQWMVSSMAVAQVNAETTKAVQQVTAQSRQVVANHVAKFVSEQMVPAIELSRG